MPSVIVTKHRSIQFLNIQICKMLHIFDLFFKNTYKLPYGNIEKSGFYGFVGWLPKEVV